MAPFGGRKKPLRVGSSEHNNTDCWAIETLNARHPCTRWLCCLFALRLPESSNLDTLWRRKKPLRTGLAHTLADATPQTPKPVLR